MADTLTQTTPRRKRTRKPAEGTEPSAGRARPNRVGNVRAARNGHRDEHGQTLAGYAVAGCRNVRCVYHGACEITAERPDDVHPDVADGCLVRVRRVAGQAEIAHCYTCRLPGEEIPESAAVIHDTELATD